MPDGDELAFADAVGPASFAHIEPILAVLDGASDERGDKQAVIAASPGGDVMLYTAGPILREDVVVGSMHSAPTLEAFVDMGVGVATR